MSLITMVSSLSEMIQQLAYKICKDGWYTRFENNGWRPVSDKIFDELVDPVYCETTQKTIKYHYSKLQRKNDVEKKKKAKKVDWLKKMYAVGAKVAPSHVEAEGHEELLQWSIALNYDVYLFNWISLATTGKSDDPKTFMNDGPSASVKVELQTLKTDHTLRPLSSKSISSLRDLYLTDHIESEVF